MVCLNIVRIRVHSFKIVRFARCRFAVAMSRAFASIPHIEQVWLLWGVLRPLSNWHIRAVAFSWWLEMYALILWTVWNLSFFRDLGVVRFVEVVPMVGLPFTVSLAGWRNLHGAGFYFDDGIWISKSWFLRAVDDCFSPGRSNGKMFIGKIYWDPEYSVTFYWEGGIQFYSSTETFFQSFLK